MPELPEVETTRRGIAPHLTGHRVTRVVVRERRLRWPVPPSLPRSLTGQVIQHVGRRAKYLLLATRAGTVILHLGMSGSLRIVLGHEPPGKHDHVDLELDSHRILRFNDPRRFGALLWTRSDPSRHRLLRDLGPEPLDESFDGAYLYDSARGRRAPIKQHLMNSRVVVGLGNIYANEALFRAGIHPRRAAGRIALPRMQELTGSVKEVLRDAIELGGTTLRDFTRSDGTPGHFQLSLDAYGRSGEPCVRCGRPIKRIVLGQRSTYYCGACQR